MASLAARWEPTARIEWRNVGPVVTGPADPFVARSQTRAARTRTASSRQPRPAARPGCIKAHRVLATWSPNKETRLAHLQAVVKSGDAL